MRNIASLFQLETTGIYLVEEIHSVVLFPLEDGRFKLSQLVMGATYEVHGHPTTVSGERGHPTASLDGGTAGATATSSSPVVPFGTYTSPTFSLPPPHPPRPKRVTISKTIVLVSVQPKDNHGPGSSKASKIDFQVVTNIVLTLQPPQCSLTTVGQLVAQQVGFDVILLDSKAYPLLPSDATSGVQFWKSSRRVLAASKALYEKCTGIDANVMRACGEQAQPPAKKKKRVDQGVECELPLQVVVDKISAVEVKLGSIEEKLAFLVDLGHGFTCVICKGPATSPAVSPCCQRVIGCQDCVDSWVASNPRCPLCGTEDVVAQRFVLKGFTDALAVLRAQCRDTESHVIPSPPHGPVDSDDDDFEDLPVAFPPQ